MATTAKRKPATVAEMRREVESLATEVRRVVGVLERMQENARTMLEITQFQGELIKRTVDVVERDLGLPPIERKPRLAVHGAHAQDDAPAPVAALEPVVDLLQYLEGKTGDGA